MRAAVAAVACTLSVSLISTTTPAIAEENTSAVAKLQGALNGNASVSSLAGAIADVQEEIARLASEIGQFRERANQALCALQDARNLSATARRGTGACGGTARHGQPGGGSGRGKARRASRFSFPRRKPSGACPCGGGRGSG